MTGQKINENFPDRRAIIADICPAISLRDLSFENKYGDRERFNQNLFWKNTSDKAITPFEVVVLKYDPFSRRMLGTRWTVDGRNSADWPPLAPGEGSKDGTIEYGSDDVFTEIAYVRQDIIQSRHNMNLEAPDKVAAAIRDVVEVVRHHGTL
jgi:hypothetical protein